MRKALAAVALVFVPLAAAGCTTLAGAARQEQLATYDERALIAAELAFSFVIQTANSAAASGAIGPSEAEQLIVLLDRAHASILRARALYDAGNALDAAVATQDVIAQVSAATALLEQLGLLRRGGL